MHSTFQFMKWLPGVAAILVSSAAVAADCAAIDTGVLVRRASATISSTALDRGKSQPLKVYMTASGNASVVVGSGRDVCLRYQLTGVRRLKKVAAASHQQCTPETTKPVEGVPSCAAWRDNRSKLDKLNVRQLVEGELAPGTGPAIQPGGRIQVLLGFCSRRGTASYLCIETTRATN